MLRRIFGSSRGKMTGDWTELHNKVLYNFHSSANIIRRIKSRRMIGGACSTWGRSEMGAKLGNLKEDTIRKT
jgi:hypothetical protein